MRSIVILLLFAGMAIVLNSIYEERLKRASSNVKVEYRFVPRTVYEEQMEKKDIVGLYKGMFDRSTPWLPEDLRPADDSATQKP
jgi:hypothetical protein